MSQRNIIYFDLETQKSAADVGGWSNSHLMQISVAVTWHTDTQQFHVFHERDCFKLAEHLAEADLVVGFNVKGFDYSVLSAYTPMNLHKIPTLDMLDEVRRILGHRLSLDALAGPTLKVGKSADGLQALQWWKEGKIDQIVEYCKQDVAVTRDLYLHGCEHKSVQFINKRGTMQKIPVNWEA